MSSTPTEYASLASDCIHNMALKYCVRCMRAEIERLWREHDEDMDRMDRAAATIERLSAGGRS